MERKTQLRGSRDTSAVRYLVAVLLSLFLHILPFPVYLLSGLGLLHSRADTTIEDIDHPTIIPIEFGVEEEPPNGLPPLPADVPPTLAVDAIPSAPLPKPPPVITADAGAPQPAPDAGAPDAATVEPPDAGSLEASVDASPPDAVAADATVAAADAGVPLDAAAPFAPDAALVPLLDAAIARGALQDPSAASAGPDAAAGVLDGGRDAGPDARVFQPIRDPVGLSGGARGIAPKNPNVSLMMYPERIRRHPLSLRFAGKLTEVHQWKAFFEGTSLDPIQDADRILLAGPQFRDSSRVVAVLRYNAPQARVRAAIDVLVKRSGNRGAWLNKRVPCARAFVDGGERYFVLPAPKMLVIVPPDGLEQALNLPPTIKFPGAQNEAVVLFLKYPANAFRDLPVEIPSSIESMRFSLSLDEQGGADARIDAVDKDEASAAQHAPELTERLNKSLVIDFVIAKRRLLDPITFRAEGRHIRAQTHVTEPQLRTILSMVAAQIDQLNRRPASRRAAPTGSR